MCRKQDQSESEKSLLIPLKVKEESATKNYCSICDDEEYLTLHAIDEDQVKITSFVEQNYADMEILQMIEPILETNSIEKSCCCSKKRCINSKIWKLLR